MLLIFSESRGLLSHYQELPRRSCDTGELRQLLLYSNGKVDDRGCGLLPQTCALVGSISATTSCKNGQVLPMYITKFVESTKVLVKHECQTLIV